MMSRRLRIPRRRCHSGLRPQRRHPRRHAVRVPPGDAVRSRSASRPVPAPHRLRCHPGPIAPGCRIRCWSAWAADGPVLPRSLPSLPHRAVRRRAAQARALRGQAESRRSSGAAQPVVGQPAVGQRATPHQGVERPGAGYRPVCSTRRCPRQCWSGDPGAREQAVVPPLRRRRSPRTGGPEACPQVHARPDPGGRSSSPTSGRSLLEGARERAGRTRQAAGVARIIAATRQPGVLTSVPITVSRPASR
jgi:hypothetical protein